MLETVNIMGIELRNLSRFNILVGEDRNGKEDVLDALRYNFAKNIAAKSQRDILENLEKSKESRINMILCDLYAAKNRACFISRITMGVHYTDLSKIITTLITIAIEDDLQFFVTTDNRELLESIQDVETEIGKHTSVHRINLPKKMCINYTYQEILGSLEIDEEMRGL